MKICVLGLGYIGLPTAAMFANAGHSVIGFDTDPRVLYELRSRKVTTQEEPVREVVTQALESGSLQVSESVVPADAYIICVPTPAIDSRPDLRCVSDAVKRIAAVVRPGDAIILESTVPPGTTERIIVGEIAEAGISPDAVRIAHCPERVIPGAIVQELYENARLIGGRTSLDAAFVARLYRSFCRGEIFETDCVTAELTKCIENTYRDVNIAFANELAGVCEELGVDAWETIALANRHPRVNILQPGPGVGGHCIPVDPVFLSHAIPYSTELIQSARRVNARMPYRIARRMFNAFPDGPFGKKIAILGAAYKGDVEDARESPSQHIVELLQQRGFSTTVYDPHVRRFPYPLSATLEDAVRDADALILVTPHRIFEDIDPYRIASLMRGRLLYDAHNMFDAKAWESAGFVVHVLGRAVPQPAEAALSA